MSTLVSINLKHPIKVIVTPALASKFITILKYLKYENLTKNLEISLTGNTYLYIQNIPKYQVIEDEFLFELCDYPNIPQVDFLRSVKITKS